MKKKILIGYSARKWILIISLITISTAALTFFIGYSIDENLYIVLSCTFLVAIITLLLVVILAMIDKQKQELFYKINGKLSDNKREIQSTINIKPLTKYPIKFGSWPITAQYLDRMIREFEIRKPSNVVECGSGSSTIVTASYFRELGEGKVISLEHEKKYAEITKKLLIAEGLEDWAEVITAPLKKWEIDGNTWQWYDFKPESFLNNPIDFLSVDGPPGMIQNLARYPALPVLREFMASDFLIMLDDGNRDEESEIAKHWGEEYNLQYNLSGTGRGIWLIEPKKN